MAFARFTHFLSRFFRHSAACSFATYSQIRQIRQEEDKRDLIEKCLFISLKVSEDIFYYLSTSRPNLANDVNCVSVLSMRYPLPSCIILVVVDSPACSFAHIEYRSSRIASV